MRQLEDEKLKVMFSSMKAKAPEGLKGSIMEKVMVYKPKRSPLFWLAPAAGVVGFALVLMISLGVFSSNVDMGGIASNENIPAAEVMMMDAEAPEGSEAFAAREAIADGGSADEMAGYGRNADAAPASTLAPKAIYAKEEVPIGGISAPQRGYSTVNLSAKIENSESQTVMLLSGLHDTGHWKSILTELNKICDPFIRTDNYGNFMVDAGIFIESVDLFDEKVSSQLCYPENTHQGSVLFRVEIYK